MSLDKALRPTRHSIIRRSVLVTGFFVAGHGFYYLLLLWANKALDPANFGRFYAGWAILNVLVTPGSVLVLFFAGYFAEGFRIGGGPAVVPSLRRIAGALAPWVVGAVVACETLLYLGGAVVGVDAFSTIVLLPILALSFFAVELLRAAFQAMLRFVWFGASWLACCMLQCALGVGALKLVAAPWAAFGGMLTANVLTVGTLAVALRDKSRPSNVPNPVPAPGFRQALPFCSAYAGLVLFNYIDVFVAYMNTDANQLGTYAAATVLPKAIVTATQPVVQIVLPVVINIRSQVKQISRAVAKAAVMAFAIAAAGLAFLWSSSGLVCGGRYGIRFCTPNLMLVLALAAMPLAVVRVWITADLAQHRYWLAHMPFVLLGAFVGIEMLSPQPIEGLAEAYAIACWAVCLAVGFASLLRAANRRPQLTST